MDIEVIVKYNGSILEIAEELGISAEVLTNDIAILTINESDIDKLLEYSQIEYMELAKWLGIVQLSMRASCISIVQPPSQYSLTGEGVIVAVLDSGIDYTHRDFIDENGNSRIMYIWDQNIEGRPPAGFNLGSEYDNSEINAALRAETEEERLQIVPSQDTNGHGTAVAGIAAGNGLSSDNYYMGAAPNASIIVVKLASNRSAYMTRTTDLMRALRYVVDKAQQHNMPVVINLSFGTNDGSHLGISLFEQYIDEISGFWKTSIVVASGNEGYARHHFNAIISQGETVDIEFVVAPNLSDLTIVIWKDFADEFNYELIAPNGESTGVLRGIGQEDNYILNNIQVNFFQGQPTPYAPWQGINLELNSIDGNPIPSSLWRLRVSGTDVVSRVFDAWLPISEIVGLETAFLNPSVETTLTIPSTADKVITVSGYNAVDGSFATFSGRGNDRIKPDLAAPAIDIIGPLVGGGYGIFTGTSFAAPHVAGGAALMMQWGIVLGNDINLYGQRVKAYLRKGATRNLNISYPDISWGYGTLCIRASLDELIQYKYLTGGENRTPLPAERFNPFTDRSSRINEDLETS